MKKLFLGNWALLFCFAFGASFWLTPVPAGLTPEAWHLLGLFVTTIIAIILKPLPMGATVLITMTITMLTKTLSPDQTFHGFTSKVVWLVVMAFFIAKGFEVTGLGNRIAYVFTRFFGKKTLGLSYGLLATELVMAPVVPSATARTAGIIYPILQAISHSFNSHPNSDSSRKVGAFLTTTAFQGTAITSGMFMTAMAANPLAVELAKTQGVEVSWGLWALAACVPGLVSLILMPLFVYKIFPPTLKSTPEAPLHAKEKLKAMGNMKWQEWLMLGVLVLLLVLWVSGKTLGIDAVVTAMLGLSILLVTGVLDWKALLKETSAWETLLWFSVLIMMASALNTLGVISWFSELATEPFSGVRWQIAFPILALIYFYSHYFFASSAAHVAAMFLSLFSMVVLLGTPPLLAVLSLMFISNLFGGLTHYSLAPAPLLFGAGYVKIKDWWRIGFLVSLLNITIWSTVGVAWWKFLGLW